MADLDDFFAKKDRKKLKNVKKFATTDGIARKLEDATKKVDKPIKKDRTNADGEEGDAEIHEQDEWKDFEEEKKDYSGLKIGHLSINADSGNSGNQEKGGDSNNSSCNEGGNNSEKNSSDNPNANDSNQTSGPWKKVQQSSAEQPVVEVAPAPAPAPAATGGYVPPALRGPRPTQASRLKSRAAPDITNEEYFPTLSGAAKPETASRKTWSEGTFEEVRHNKASSLRQSSDQQRGTSGGHSQGPKLNLGNRFNTLSNDS